MSAGPAPFTYELPMSAGPAAAAEAIRPPPTRVLSSCFRPRAAHALAIRRQQQLQQPQSSRVDKHAPLCFALGDDDSSAATRECAELSASFDLLSRSTHAVLEALTQRVHTLSERLAKAESQQQQQHEDELTRANAMTLQMRVQQEQLHERRRETERLEERIMQLESVLHELARQRTSDEAIPPPRPPPLPPHARVSERPPPPAAAAQAQPADHEPERLPSWLPPPAPESKEEIEARETRVPSSATRELFTRQSSPHPASPPVVPRNAGDSDSDNNGGYVGTYGGGSDDDDAEPLKHEEEHEEEGAAKAEAEPSPSPPPSSRSTSLLSMTQPAQSSLVSKRMQAAKPAQQQPSAASQQARPVAAVARSASQQPPAASKRKAAPAKKKPKQKRRHVLTPKMSQAQVFELSDEDTPSSSVSNYSDQGSDSDSDASPPPRSRSRQRARKAARPPKPKLEPADADAGAAGSGDDIAELETRAPLFPDMAAGGSTVAGAKQPSPASSAGRSKQRSSGTATAGGTQKKRKRSAFKSSSAFQRSLLPPVNVAPAGLAPVPYTPCILTQTDEGLSEGIELRRRGKPVNYALMDG